MEKTNIYDILRQIQEELKVPKSRYNKFGDFTYRSCEDILEAIKPLLSKYGAAILLSDEIINIGDRYYIKATAQLSNAEGSLSTTGFARESFEIKKMHDAQVTGSASSYARKYALCGLFAIDHSSDADDMKPKQPDQNELVSQQELKKLYQLANGKDTRTITWFMQSYGYQNSKEIRKKDFEKICSEIQASS